MKAGFVASLSHLLRQTSWHVPTALFALCIFAISPHASAVETCPPKGPVATGSRVTVVYDPADSSMKACVSGTWLTLSGGGGGGSVLDALTDVIITSPTIDQALVYNGGAWVNSAVTVSEADPQVATLSANKWCTANAGANAIDCTQDAPSGSTSPWINGSGGAIYYNGGNVGIGTTSPALKLDIVGGSFRVINSASNPLVSILSQNVGSFPPALVFQAQRPSAAHALAGDWLGYIDWRNANYNLSARIRVVATQNHSNTAAGSYMAFETTANGGAVTERIRITNDGNVGIGTTSPGSALDVKGTLRLSGATSGYVGLLPAAAAGSTTYTLPSADGASGQVLSTNGSGVLSWATPTGSSVSSYFWAAASHLTYASANGSCPSGSRAIQVPQSRFGQTGTQICAADTASDGARTVCDSVRYWYITIQGTSAAYASNDIACSASVPRAWPWAIQGNAPNSRPDEWQNGTYVVCCRL